MLTAIDSVTAGRPYRGNVAHLRRMQTFALLRWERACERQHLHPSLPRQTEVFSDRWLAAVVRVMRLLRLHGYAERTMRLRHG